MKLLVAVVLNCILLACTLFACTRLFVKEPHEVTKPSSTTPTHKSTI